MLNPDLRREHKWKKGATNILRLDSSAVEKIPLRNEFEVFARRAFYVHRNKETTTSNSVFRPSVRIIITFHRLASEGVTSLWRGGSLNVEIFPAEGRLSDRLQSAENQHVRLTMSAQVEAKRQILGPSGDIPQIKTAQDDVSHRKKTCAAKILIGSGDFHLCTDENQTETVRLQVQDSARDTGVFCLQTTGKHSRKAVGKDSPRKTSKT